MATADPVSLARSISAGVAVLAASLLLGMATFHLQGVLPDAWAPFANSCSGWTLLTAVLVWLARPGVRAAAVLGAASFLLLVWGYTIAAPAYRPLTFTVVGLVAGPVVGVAATWLRSAGPRLAVAGAVLAGIAVGDSVRGLTVVADTTEPQYWVSIGVVGVVLLVATVARLRARAADVVLVVGGTALVAALYLLAWRVLDAGVGS